MDQIWIVLVAVIAYIESAPGIAQPGFVNVVCSGSGQKIVEFKVRSCLISYGWQVLQIENALPVDEDAAYDEEIWELIEDVRQNSEHIRLATLHSYRVN